MENTSSLMAVVTYLCTFEVPILTPEEKEIIEKRESNDGAIAGVRKLLSFMCRKDKKALIELKVAYGKTGQSHVEDYLSEELSKAYGYCNGDSVFSNFSEDMPS